MVKNLLKDFSRADNYRNFLQTKEQYHSNKQKIKNDNLS